jgi:GxxExxY protein
MNRSPFQQEGYDLISAAFEVYDQQGSGYLEDVYHECLERELTSHRIPWVTKPALVIHYKGQPLNRHYYPDMVIHTEIVVELKAVRTLTPEHEAQLLHYLRGTRKRVGYLINFGSHPQLEWKRFLVNHAIPS